MSPRVHTRLGISLAVRYRTAGAFLVAYTTNLSRGGLFIEAEELPAKGTSMTVSVHVPGMAIPLELSGRVAWVREQPSEDKPRGFGVELDDFDNQYGAAVDQLVSRFDRLKIAVIAWGGSRGQIVRYLRNILTCEVLECSGTDAARAAFAAPVDLAVIDLDSCPDDGLALLDLANGQAQQPTPVIVLAREESMRSRARDLGAADALTTPTSYEALQSSVLKTLARPSDVRSTSPTDPVR